MTMPHAPNAPIDRATLDAQALDYHAQKPAGKVGITLVKPCATQRDLSLAYTPGVAAPCREIARDPDLVYRYTSRGNLVAVISNGTAVLGLGDIGPLAGKPVMEGKAVLFKRFGDVNCFDIELTSRAVDEFCQVVEALSPTFGGINIEDVKAPECFEIEARLSRTLDIPIFHDDQHGTAIVSGAALLNALWIAGKSIETAKFVFVGAGAAGIACARFYRSLGMRPGNLKMFDRAGLIHAARPNLNRWKADFAWEGAPMTLGEALRGADVFVGVSVGNQLTPEMLREMASDPIVLALANPTPEIDPALALATRSDAIVATGRSDYPNQVNNVLGYPSIFRGALDVRARAIDESMKRAASQALAELAHEPVLPEVAAAYGGSLPSFGRDALIPKPFDPRVVLRVAPAVARAAMASGLARVPIDLEAYPAELEARMRQARG
jgi:malate dehydrogenase (oxaloacetate-decarboxylating)(NADP+)